MMHKCGKSNSSQLSQVHSINYVSRILPRFRCYYPFDCKLRAKICIKFEDNRTWSKTTMHNISPNDAQPEEQQIHLIWAHSSSLCQWDLDWIWMVITLSPVNCVQECAPNLRSIWYTCTTRNYTCIGSVTSALMFSSLMHKGVEFLWCVL